MLLHCFSLLYHSRANTSVEILLWTIKQANSHSKTLMHASPVMARFVRHTICMQDRQSVVARFVRHSICMADEAHDGRSVALKYLSDGVLDRPKKNFYIRTSACLISFMTANTSIVYQYCIACNNQPLRYHNIRHCCPNSPKLSGTSRRKTCTSLRVCEFAKAIL